jgi:hypothetical protein
LHTPTHFFTRFRPEAFISVSHPLSHRNYD